MDINSSVNYYNIPQQKPSFKAIVVDKIKPVYVSEDINFLNNETAMLKKSAPFFDGIKKLLDSIVSKHLTSRPKPVNWIYLDDIERLYEISDTLPKELFQNRKLLGLIGTGCNNMALKLDKKEVLCVSDDMEFLKKRKVENFDLPFLRIGMFGENKKRGWFIRKYGEPVTDTELQTLEKQITDKGYKVCDWRPEQACKVDNKIYLLDFECAKK